jgi:hypothetical protein
VKAPPPARAGVTAGTKEPTESTGFGQETGAATERSWGSAPEQKELELGPRELDDSERHWAAA